ncbi:MAG TPA: class II aldolase/adducin family protein [Kiloniellaceae bacterium]
MAMPQEVPHIDCSPAEWEMRVDLAAAFRLVDLYGWSDLLATHLSARVPGPEDHFLINPFGLMFDEITASNLVKVDQEGNICSKTDYTINPAGFVIHGALHMALPEVACVIHTHTRAGVGVATQKDGLLPITQHAMAVIAQTGYHEYQGIATDLAERESLVADLGDNRVLVMRNHGLLTVGRTVGEAFMWMYRAERACYMQLSVQQSGAALNPIPEEVQRTTIERNRFNNSEKGYRPIGRVEWPALRRRLDRLDPSYKE